MTAPPDSELVARAWLEYADGDLAAARGGIELAAIPGWIIGFHAQQAAEKAFKAALALAGVEPPRTHDLLRLDALLQQAGWAPPLSGEDLVKLGRFAVEDRYPILDAPRVTRDVAADLVPLAERALAWSVQLAFAATSDLTDPAEEVVARIQGLVSEALHGLAPQLRSWAEAHLVSPRRIELVTDLDSGTQATFWLVTDHVGHDDSSYRVVYDPGTGMFGHAMTIQDGAEWMFGLVGPTFSEAVEHM